jgi:hypothetical protein
MLTVICSLFPYWWQRVGSNQKPLNITAADTLIERTLVQPDSLRCCKGRLPASPLLTYAVMDSNRNSVQNKLVCCGIMLAKLANQTRFGYCASLYATKQ